MLDSRRRVPNPVFRWFALASFLGSILSVLTGAAVRLTGSGLGCPDWPTCFKGRVTGSMSIHPFIEYGNRMVNAAFILVIGATVVAAWYRAERRRDLVGLSLGLVAGVVGDAVLGAFVVYSRLNPYLVSLHMVLSLSMVVLAATLYHHSKYLYGPGRRADRRDRCERGDSWGRWFRRAVESLLLGLHPATGTASRLNGTMSGLARARR